MYNIVCMWYYNSMAIAPVALLQLFLNGNLRVYIILENVSKLSNTKSRKVNGICQVVVCTNECLTRLAV